MAQSANINAPGGYLTNSDTELLVRGVSVIAFVLIAVLMYLTVKSIPSTLIIMINLPSALVGGVISVASLVGKNKAKVRIC